MLWKISDLLRRRICALPLEARNPACDAAAALIYWPLARIAGFAEILGLRIENLPLADFRKASFARMRSNARDRLGTPLEQRFTAPEIKKMLTDAGMADIRFRDGFPYWCAVGLKKRK
jgi:hypothetical protein